MSDDAPSDENQADAATNCSHIVFFLVQATGFGRIGLQVDEVGRESQFSGGCQGVIKVLRAYRSCLTLATGYNLIAGVETKLVRSAVQMVDASESGILRKVEVIRTAQGTLQFAPVLALWLTSTLSIVVHNNKPRATNREHQRKAKMNCTKRCILRHRLKLTKRIERQVPLHRSINDRGYSVLLMNAAVRVQTNICQAGVLSQATWYIEGCHVAHPSLLGCECLKLQHNIIVGIIVSCQVLHTGGLALQF